jgi:hypothetical protein
MGGMPGQTMPGHSMPGHGGDPGDGLVSVKDGYTLTLLTPKDAGATTTGATQVTFRVDDASGSAVKDFVDLQTKKMHLYLVRTDLTGFQHVHPTLGSDGVWAAPVTFAAGPYRIFTDFVLKGPDGSDLPIALSRTVTVPGVFTAAPVGPEVRTTSVDGFRVSLTGALKAGVASPLVVNVTKAGQPVKDLETYLDTYAHVTAFHSPDLAFVHLHPDGAEAPVSGKGGPDLKLTAEVRQAGAYRVHVQFQQGGQLHTAVFTVNAS